MTSTPASGPISRCSAVGTEHRVGARNPAGLVRRDGRQPAARHPRPADARARPGLLHDRVGRTRVNAVVAAGPAGRRIPHCCTTGLARSTWRARCRPVGSSRTASATCCSASPRARGRPGVGRAAQGVRRTRPGDHPADLDHRVAPAAGRRRGVRDRPGAADRRRYPLAATTLSWSRSFGDAEPEPLHRRRRAQHGRLLRAPGLRAPAAVRVRGQRLRHLGAHAVRLGRRGRAASGHRVPSPPTASDSVELAAGRRGRRRARPSRAAGRCSCTCARSDIWATPAPTSRPAYRGARRDRRRRRSRPAARAGPPHRVGSRRRPAWRATTRSAATVEQIAESLARPAEAGLRRPPSSRPLAPRRAEAIRRLAIRLAAATCASGSSAAGCPSTPARSRWRRRSTPP